LATNQQASGVVEDHTIKETKNDKPKHVTWSQDETETPEPQQSLEPKTPETTIVPDELTKVESKDIAVEKELKEEKVTWLKLADLNLFLRLIIIDF